MDEVLDNDLTSTAVNAPVITKNEAIYTFTKLSREELTQKFENFIQKRGYKLEVGVPGNGIYGKGSKVMRVLFGAFVKRFAWKVVIEDMGGSTQLTFFKEAKGYVGGVIGVNQVNNEFKAIVGSLTQFHSSQEN